MKPLFTSSYHTLLLTIATFALLATSCKTASSDPDRRDNSVGSWTKKSTNGKAPTAGSANQITIKKSSAKDTYLSVSGLAQKDSTSF
ncbi:hypothetical protein [Fibrella forsythiae]|uniref:Uncharacterized protein n=1 Tax=Fibrella forsythiae TaxID=2817061 RepID=A0ABS3JG54_9BACT|nr:hypothetical protein [Fibrella forsythiae]MBO0948985.1 hypothetical protein [Fibrella forsythiae]